MGFAPGLQIYLELYAALWLFSKGHCSQLIVVHLCAGDAYAVPGNLDSVDAPLSVAIKKTQKPVKHWE